MRDPLHIRLLRALLLLYPREFRLRNAASIVAVARATRASRTRVLLDAVVTLVRAWRDVIVDVLRKPLRPSALVAGAARDARLALRGLRRRPVDGLVVIVTLGVALGANVAIYTVSHTLLLETLPYSDPERIMDVDPPVVSMIRVRDDFSWKVASVLTEHPGVEAAATYYPEAGANLERGSDASRVRITQVSPDFFGALGVRMLLGPGMSEEAGAGDRAVLSYELWRTAFGSDRDIVGRSIQLNGRAYVVAGVAPQEVDFPGGTELWLSDPPVGEFFVGAYGPDVIVRVRPGALPAVQAAVAEYTEREREQAGPEYADHIRDAQFTPLRDRLAQSVELPLLVLTAAAFVVLLLGCLNVAGVMIARLAGRGEELAMRRALGASRMRIFGQLLSELGVLAFLAGVLSVVLAVVLIPLLASMLPAATPRLAAAMRPDAATWLFAGMATLFAALAAGLPPAIAAARASAGAGHPDRIRGDDPGRRRGHVVLTTAQVALAVTLVVVAAMFGRTLAALRAVPLGYDTESVLTFEVNLPEARYGTAPAARAWLDEVLARIRALPGVEAAGAIDRLPLSRSMGVSYTLERPDGSEPSRVSAGYRRATAELFDALGVRLLAGRSFASERAAGEEVVISRELAVRLFGTSHPIGQRIVIGPGPRSREATVVGVVNDIRFGGADSEIMPAFYGDLAPSPLGRLSIAVRTSAEPRALADGVRGVLREVDPQVPPFQLRTTGDAAWQVIAARRAVAIVATLFGAAALALALLALYGMLSQSVAMRRRELGVRLALGAPVRSIEALIVRRGLACTAAGLAVGLLLSFNAMNLIEGMLFGVAPRDYTVLAVTAVAVLVAALSASWIPARRAGQTDPITSLR